jgi:DNA-binding transcriptional LysR family regulator
MAGASTDPRGRVRVNAPVSFSQLFLANALAGFLPAYPEVKVELTSADAYVDVVEGGYDLVIRIGQLTDSSLVARRLSADRLVVVGSPAYFAKHGRPTTPAELVGHNCIHYMVVSIAGEWRFRDANRQPFVVPVSSNLECSDGMTVRQAAIAGIGLGVMPRFMVERAVEEGRLEIVLEGARRAEVGVYAMFASRKQLPARTKVLLDYLSSWFADPDWRLRASQ